MDAGEGYSVGGGELVDLDVDGWGWTGLRDVLLNRILLYARREAPPWVWWFRHGSGVHMVRLTSMPANGAVTFGVWGGRI